MYVHIRKIVLFSSIYFTNNIIGGELDTYNVINVLLQIPHAVNVNFSPL
jgi:hypothetical protein